MTQFRGRRVLVTGASGFLGTPLCRRLAEAGAEVHAVSRAERAPVPDGPRWWRLDMADAEGVRDVLATVKPDVVFHLSGAVNSAPTLGLVLPTFHSLATSTVVLLAAANEVGVGRGVLIGSIDEPTGDVAEASPPSPYGAAKWAASVYGRMFHRLYGTPVVTARTFMTYGPGQPEWKLIPYTILSLLEGRSPELSSGERCLDWVYIDDVVDGLALTGLMPDLEGTTVDLGAGTAVSIREIVLRLVQLVGLPIEPRFAARADHPSRTVRIADTRQAWARLGWMPSIPLDEGLAVTVEWFRNQYRQRRSVA